MGEKKDGGRPGRKAKVATALAAAAAVILAALLLVRGTGPSPASSVVLVTLDTLRPDHLSCYGYARDTSPHIDRLAAEGARFTEAVSQSTWTIPSIYSILTSTYPHVHGMISRPSLHAQLNPCIPRVTDTLREGGVASALFTNHPWLRGCRDLGFDVHHVAYLPGAEDLEPTSAEARKALQWYKSAATELITSEAVRWIEQRDGEPFFVWIHYLSPHYPFSPELDLGKGFAGDELSGAYEDVPVEEVNALARIPGKRDVDYYVAQYDGEVRFVDESVGRLVRELDRLGLADRTALIVSADHGEELGERNRFFQHRRKPWESLIRVPLIVRCPRRPSAGAVVDTQVRSIDIAPTVLELVGLEPDEAMQGRSLLPLLDGRGEREPPGALSAWCEKGVFSIRKQGWKLIVDPEGQDLLFDLRRDPLEQQDLSGSQTERAVSLKAELEALLGRDLSGGGLDEQTRRELRSLGYVN